MDSQEILGELPRLRRYARALLGDRAAADDLVQDTLERAWTRIAQWQRGSDLRAWLFNIMHNLRVDQIRRPKLNARAIEEEDFEVPTRSTQNDRLEVRDLELALNKLPDEQREILLLVALEEMSYSEIAKILEIPVGTVMSRLSRARERLRIVMDGRQSGANLRVVR